MIALKNIFTLLCLTTCPLQAAKEIELKISITEQQYPHLQEWLKNNAVYKGVSQQTEYYVTNPETPWNESKGFKDTAITMRVRQESKGDTFCYKQAHFDSATKKPTHRDEYETKVESGTTILQILTLLGYTRHTLLSKKRTTYLVRDTFEIVLDEVQGVGNFIEIELKIPTDNVQTGIRSIEALLREISITQFTQYERSYIHMIWNPGYNFGTQRTLT